MSPSNLLRKIAANDSRRADSLACSGNRRTRDLGKPWLVESVRLAEIAAEIETD